VTKSIGEFSSDAGTLYLEYEEHEDEPFQVWFEDFCILGQGATKVEAFRSAARQTAQIANLIAESVETVSADDNDSTVAGNRRLR